MNYSMSLDTLVPVFVQLSCWRNIRGLSETETGCSFVDCQRPSQIPFLWTLRGRRRWFLWIDWCDGKDKPGNQGAANDLEPGVDLDGATRQAPRYAP